MEYHTSLKRFGSNFGTAYNLRTYPHATFNSKTKRNMLKDIHAVYRWTHISSQVSSKLDEKNVDGHTYYTRH